MNNKTLFLNVALIVTMLFSLNVNKVDAFSQKPNLEVYQQGNHAKLEWAVEMLDEDVLYETGFEEEDELPDLTYNASGSRKYGGQEFTSESKYKGKRSLKVENSYKNGNYRQVDFKGNVSYLNSSKARFAEKKYMSNGTDLSLSFRAKTTGNGVVTFTGIGGAADYGTPMNITFLEKVNKGDRVIKVSDPLYFKRMTDSGKRIYLADRKGRYRYVEVRGVNLKDSTIKLNKGMTGEFEKGDRLLRHNHRNPVVFGGRSFSQKDGWKLFNVNTKVLDLRDYNTLDRGFRLWINTTTRDRVYIDDFRMGYATKAQLFRGNKKLYEGFLSDYEDKQAIDKGKPEKVSTLKVTTEKGKRYLDVKEPRDNGTEYGYDVRAVANDGTTYSSGKKVVNIISGVKGYSYTFDGNKNTLPNGKIENKTGKIEVPLEVNENMYLHIQAIDGEGNKSDVTHIPLKDYIKSYLDLSIGSLDSIEDITLQKEPKIVSTSFKENIKIKNYYSKGGDTWELFLTATPLQKIGSSDKLPVGTLKLKTLTNVKRINGNGNNPINKMTERRIIDKGKNLLIDGNKSVGEYEVIFPKDALEIKIDPATAKAGKYRTTLNWELVNAP